MKDPRVDRRTFLAAPAIVSIVGLPQAGAKPTLAAGRKAPNMLVIVLDDVGYADLGCYGSEISTPNIDALAKGGVRFTNFHAAPLCSPTRAALLTGCNPHSVGVGVIADWSDARPGYRGEVDLAAPMLPELLGPLGYGCYASGKWHLNAIREQGTTGPYRQWPTRRGFDRWFGFQGAMADQWHPELFEGTSPVDPDGTHLSATLVDRMTGYIADHRAGAAERPFFGYLAFGACHWPLHAPRDYIDRHDGRYAGGWTKLRAERFARQQKMGLLPKGTVLPPENPDVPAWESLPAEDRVFAARCQQVYAGFLEYTDAQIGRLFAALDDMGVRDDTLIVLLSDNGATAEGSQVGMADVRGNLYIDKETAETRRAALGDLGGADSFPAYPLGWAAASNTPLRWYKSGTHEGGIRTPMIVSWPAGKIGGGGVRRQFQHVSDIGPTLFELAGIQHHGFEGTSFAYALADADAPTRKSVQLFESTGSRAIWRDGWKAVARHSMGADFKADRWELYHLDADFSEANDLAAAQPKHLLLLQESWEALAGPAKILPLDDRRLEKYRANLPARRDRAVLVPGGSRLDRLTMPDVQRACRIDAELTLNAHSEGVILAAGTSLRGFDLFVANGVLSFVYVASRGRHVRLDARQLPVGAARVVVEMTDGRTARTARLVVNGVERATARIDQSWPIHALGAGLRCGANRGAPVSKAYDGPFAFVGKIRKVEIEAGKAG